MLSFVTIVYRRDYPLIELQARSMARFVAPEMVASISIVVNDVDEAALEAKLNPQLAAYGPLADKVTIVHGDEILRPEGARSSRNPIERIYVDHRRSLPFVRRQGWRGNNGYRLQQALKLASARCAASEHMVLMDAKNLFLREVSVAEYFEPDDRARTTFMRPVSEYHRNWLRESLAVMKLPSDPSRVERTTTFSTPYPVRRSLVYELLAYIDKNYGSVQALFASKKRPSEFMLLNAYCLARYGSIEQWFADAGPVAIGLWPTYDSARMKQEIDKLDDPQALSLGLHNRAVSALAEPQLNRIAAALEQRGIATRDQLLTVMKRIDAIGN